ncbi:MAG TPA: AAA family ATPase [Candidatus Desulfobacillus sp.]|nr:AAA family ATPase [Candidatus Desulfobacillus sp.]
MYLEHFGLSEPPFRITPNTGFFFAGANRGATLEALLYAITHDEGIVKVSGEVGSGKTLLCRVLMERLPENVETIHLVNPSLSREEILFTLADELRIDLASNRASAVMRALQEHLIELYGKGRQVVVLIDEAHAMPAETLEEIRLLSNLESNRHKLLQIVLFGQPELDETLGRSEMRQLKERITHNFSLEPLVRADIAQYIDFRMRAAGYKGPDVFSPQALKLIAGASLGLTRRINILCDKALLAAFAANTHQITADHVRAAIRDADFRSAPSSGRALWLGVAVAILVLFAAGIAFFYRPGGSATSADQAAAVPRGAPSAAGETAQAATEAGKTATTDDNASGSFKDTGNPVVTSIDGGKAAAVAQSVAPMVPAESAASQGVPAGTGANPAKAEASVQAPRVGRLTQQRLDATEDWLNSTSGSRWFIQLLTTEAGDASHVESFLAAASKLVDPERLRVYRTSSKSQPRMGVIYGDYASQQEAGEAISALPAALRRNGPYARQLRQLQH